MGLFWPLASKANFGAVRGGFGEALAVPDGPKMSPDGPRWCQDGRVLSPIALALAIDVPRTVQLLSVGN